MIVSQEVFEWLEKIGMIAGGRETAHGQVELPREAAEGIMSGRLMASIMLKALGNKQPLMKDQNSIQNLRNVSMQQQPNDNHQLAASERLYVWNILSSLLNRIKISISGDEKSLIIAGDEDIAVGLLLEIMKKSSEGKGKGAVSPNNSRPQKRNLNIMQQIDDDAKTKIQDVHQPQRPMKPDDRSNRPPVSGGNSHKSTPAQGYRPVPREFPAGLSSPVRSASNFGANQNAMLPFIQNGSPNNDRYGLHSEGSSFKHAGNHLNINIASYSSVQSNPSPYAERNVLSAMIHAISTILSTSLGLNLHDAIQILVEPGQPKIKLLFCKAAWPHVSDETHLQILRELESKILVTLKSNSDLQKEMYHANDVHVFLSVVHFAVLSSSNSTVQLACKILRETSTCRTDQHWSSLLWMWLSRREMGGGAISTFLDAFRKHRDMISRGLIITLLLSLARANIRALFAVELPARLLDDAENLNVLSAILKYIANDPSSHEVFVKGGGLIEMLQFIQRESPASRPRSNRIAAITILATFWVGFLNDLASIQGLQDKLWITLRTLLPQPDPASSDLEKKNENNLNNGSIGQTATSAEDLQSAFSANQALLQLLSGFIDARSSNSSLAYKLVVQALLTWYSNTEMRKLIQTHLGNILQSTPRMPLSILIEPYMKKVQSHGVSDFDHSFLSILSRHPRLEPAHGLMMLDVLAQICISKQKEEFSDIFIFLLDRFRTYESVQDFVKRLVKLCLSVALMGSKVLKEMNIEIHRKEQPRLETRLHVLSLVHRIVKLSCSAFNDGIKHLIETVIKSKEELDPAIASLFQELGALIGLVRASQEVRAQDVVRSQSSGASDINRKSVNEAPRRDKPVQLVQRSVQAPIVKNMKEGVKNEPPRYIHSAESDDSVLLSDVDSPRKEAYTILSSERSSRSEKHPAMVPQPNPNVVLHPPKDRIREPKLNRENSRPELQMQEDLKQPQPPQAPSQKISAAERRAANLERAKKLEEERKKAIISKREDQDDRKAKKLPNVLTKDEVLSQVAKKEKKSLVPGRPSSVLRGRGGRDSRSSMSDGNSDDDRMSLPPPEGPLQRLMRPTSPKTKKREAEIAEIKRKREMRLQMQKEQAEMARARERELFLKARMEVEQRMAVLKKARGELLPSESFLDEERGEGSFMDDSPTRESNTAPRFNLREHAKHFTSNSRFDLERHVFMWKNEPRRRETVQTVLRILEEIFVEVTTDRSESSLALPRKGVRLRRNGEEMGSRQSDGQENSSHRLHREDSSTSRNRDSSSFDNFDKYLLSKSSMTNDEQLKKMYRRQAYLRRKLSKYREEKALQEAQRLRDEAVIKKAMEQEKRRQRENEAQRRAKLKEKIAAYKQKLEEERKEKSLEEKKKENVSREEHRDRIQKARASRAQGHGC